MKRKALHGLFDDIVQVGPDGKKALDWLDVPFRMGWRIGSWV